MSVINNQKTFFQYYFSILFASFPLSFIAGNMIININIVILIFSALVFFQKEIFQIHYYFIDKLIICFFIFVLFTGFYNDFYFILYDLYPAGYKTILKSFLYLRYLLLYLVIRFLIEKHLINFKFFFISCSFFSIFVCLDIFYQLIFGKDIFGYEINEGSRKLSGPFGDELIAGTYIQRFSIFTFFVITFFYHERLSKYSNYLIPLLFFIFTLGIILSGNRMPFILFLLLIFLVLIFHRSTIKLLIPFIFLTVILFSIIYNSNSKVKDNFQSFYMNVSNIFIVVKNKDFQNDNVPQYLKEFSTFYDTWLMNKFIGGGIKNFRYYCHVRPNLDKSKKFICNMHPHNYYLEILTETGIIGFSIISLIFFISIYFSIISKYFLKPYKKGNNLIVPFMFLLLVEIFPIKSSGSFFTTGTASYIFIILAVTIGLSIKYNYIEKK